MNVKFMWNGIKADGKLHRARYSGGPYTPESKLPVGTITIYARDYEPLPQIDGLKVENDSDSMTDYFEKYRIRILPSNPLYAEIRAALGKQEEHNRRHFEQRTA